MKAKNLLVLAIAVTCTFSLYGCSSNDVKVIDNNSSSVSNSENSSDAYVFSYKNTEIPVDADFAPNRPAVQHRASANTTPTTILKSKPIRTETQTVSYM